MDFSLGRRVRRTSFALTIVLLIGTTAAAHGDSRRAAFSTISNRGDQVNAMASVMAARNGKEFIRFSSRDHGNCFGIKKREATGFAFTCSDDFPSPAHPILDQSVFGADTGEPIHLIQLQGFAADGVAEIDMTDVTGTVLARTQVVGNVYSLEAVPPSAVRVIALDAQGRALFAVPR